MGVFFGTRTVAPGETSIHGPCPARILKLLNSASRYLGGLRPLHRVFPTASNGVSADVVPVPGVRMPSRLPSAAAAWNAFAPSWKAMYQWLPAWQSRSMVNQASGGG